MIRESQYELCERARKAFEEWNLDANQGYDLTTNTSGVMHTYEDIRTEHAWRGFAQLFMATRSICRRVVSAACLDSAGNVICSPRHYDVTARKVFARLEVEGRPEQGFVDQFGVFMSRTEAWKVAVAAGQIIRRCGGDETNGGTLYSENLY